MSLANPGDHTDGTGIICPLAVCPWCGARPHEPCNESAGNGRTRILIPPQYHLARTVSKEAFMGLLRRDEVGTVTTMESMESRERLVLLVGGPAHGQVVMTFQAGYVVQTLWADDDPDADPVIPRSWHYTVKRLVILDQIIWIGSIGDPTQGNLVDALLSTAAKAATSGTVVCRTRGEVTL